MAIALRSAGIVASTQVAVPVFFRGNQVGGFFADMLVNDAVILELKAGRNLDPAHEAQLLNYLKATPIEVGLRLNVGPEPSFKRLAFDNSRKQIRVHPR